jgi:hypothetical protein
MALTQQRYLSAGEVESYDWDRIVSKCTDWPVGTIHDPLLVVQNIEENPTCEIGGIPRRLEAFENPLYLLSSFIIVAYPGNDNLTLRILGSDQILTTEKASKLLETVCAKIESFSTKI